MTPVVVLAAEAGGHGGFSLPALAFGVVLLIANGFFVAAEIALLAARRARIEERADAGDPRARIALAALQELSITFSGAQLGITMASLGLGAVAEPAVAGIIVELLGFADISDALRNGIAFAVGLSLVVFLHMVVGEMAPKNLALARAEEVSLRLARAFRGYVFLLRPLILLLNGTANLLVRAVGVAPVDEHDLVHTPAELAQALRESQREGTVDASDIRVMSAVLRLADIDAEAAMTPRVDLEIVQDTAWATEVLARAAETGHSRFPVVHGHGDAVVGIVHTKDVLIRDPDHLADVTVAEVLRPIAAVPETRDLQRLLADMRSDRSHAVLVVDEFGATSGLVTMEDVLEELVGDIEDEFDPGTARRSRRGHGWIVDGLLRRDELERLCRLRLPDGETETVNGYIVERLARLPVRGDQVSAGDGWKMRVLSLRGRRAGRVEVTPPTDGTGDRQTPEGN
jgi:CBS domain containing-hemolysin-like protein